MKLSRRELLILAGASSGALYLNAPAVGADDAPSEGAAELPSCVVTPQQTEGPYFVDERLERADIRSDPRDGSLCDGAPLQLTLRVRGVRGSACTALPGAVVDLWHCDARGVYSGVRDPGFETVARGFLRGYQRADAAGAVTFSTVYPGWYPGRAVHVHFKVLARAEGRTVEWTSQLYFDGAVTERVYARPPYAERGTPPSNRADGIYRSGGPALTLTPVASSSGYVASFDIGLKLA